MAWLYPRVGEVPVQALSRSAVSRVSVGCRTKQTKVMSATANSYHGTEAIAVGSLVNTLQASGTILRNPFISLIVGVRSRPDVIPPEIRSVGISVIHLLRGPFASHDEIRDPVPQVGMSVDSDRSVTFAEAPSGFANLPAWWAVDLPSKIACQWIVIQKRTNVVSRQIIARLPDVWHTLRSHLTPLWSLWSGGEASGCNAVSSLNYMVCEGEGTA